MWCNLMGNFTKANKIFICQKAAVCILVDTNYGQLCKPIFLELCIMTLFSINWFEMLKYTKLNINNFYTYISKNANNLVIVKNIRNKCYYCVDVFMLN